MMCSSTTPREKNGVGMWQLGDSGGESMQVGHCVVDVDPSSAYSYCRHSLTEFRSLEPSAKNEKPVTVAEASFRFASTVVGS